MHGLQYLEGYPGEIERYVQAIQDYFNKRCPDAPRVLRPRKLELYNWIIQEDYKKEVLSALEYCPDWTHGKPLQVKLLEEIAPRLLGFEAVHVQPRGHEIGQFQIHGKLLGIRRDPWKWHNGRWVEGL